MKAETITDKNFLSQITFELLNKDTWTKFVQLFGNKGACGNCWCMYYRLKNVDFERGKVHEGNKTAMRIMVMENRPTGILGFYKNLPIGWCAFAPREDFIRLENSRIHKRIDNNPVWSIPCFFIDKNFRRKGVMIELLRAVIKYAQENEIKIIEAYPAIPAKERLPDTFAWTGLYKAFEKMGFEIADQKSKNRPMVRYYVDKNN